MTIELSGLVYKLNEMNPHSRLKAKSLFKIMDKDCGQCSNCNINYSIIEEYEHRIKGDKRRQVIGFAERFVQEQYFNNTRIKVELGYN